MLPVPCAPAMSPHGGRFARPAPGTSVGRARVPGAGSTLCRDAQPARPQVIELLAGRRRARVPGPRGRRVVCRAGADDGRLPGARTEWVAPAAGHCPSATPPPSGVLRVCTQRAQARKCGARLAHGATRVTRPRSPRSAPGSPPRHHGLASEERNFKRTFLPAPPEATSHPFSRPRGPRGRLAGRQPLAQRAAGADRAKAAFLPYTLVPIIVSGTVYQMC